MSDLSCFEQLRQSPKIVIPECSRAKHMYNRLRFLCATDIWCAYLLACRVPLNHFIDLMFNINLMPFDIDYLTEPGFTKEEIEEVPEKTYKGEIYRALHWTLFGPDLGLCNTCAVKACPFDNPYAYANVMLCIISQIQHVAGLLLTDVNTKSVWRDMLAIVDKYDEEFHISLERMIMMVASIGWKFCQRDIALKLEVEYKRKKQCQAQEKKKKQKRVHFLDEMLKS